MAAGSNKPFGSVVPVQVPPVGDALNWTAGWLEQIELKIGEYKAG